VDEEEGGEGWGRRRRRGVRVPPRVALEGTSFTDETRTRRSNSHITHGFLSENGLEFLVPETYDTMGIIVSITI
jgi:hypothetical protein